MSLGDTYWRRDPSDERMVQSPFGDRRTATWYADPYKKCLVCGSWIEGAVDIVGPLTLIPCNHKRGYEDLCPSWGPVDGCMCYLPTHGAPTIYMGSRPGVKL